MARRTHSLWRSIAASAIALSFSIGCARKESPTSSQSITSVAQATFAVEGMHCATCPVTVKAAAERVAGVSSARVSDKEKRAWVTYDPNRASPTVIAAAITESRYPATPIDDGK